MNDPEVFRTLQSALNENPPPSVTQVMKRISHSEVTVRRHFPDLCRDIAKHYAEYRVKRAIERKAQAAEEVKRLAYELHANGISPHPPAYAPPVDQFRLPESGRGTGRLYVQFGRNWACRPIIATAFAKLWFQLCKPMGEVTDHAANMMASKAANGWFKSHMLFFLLCPSVSGDPEREVATPKPR